MKEIYGVIYMLLTIIIFNLITLLKIYIKQKQVLSNKTLFIYKTPKCVRDYFNKIESKLSNLNYPYKLTKKKYLTIKYGLSALVFVISFINYKSIQLPLMLLIATFLVPDYLIFSYTKKEKDVLTNELNSITTSIILSLTSFASLEKSLEIAGKNIKYTRLKNAYDVFVKIYVMNGYNLKNSAECLKKKFNNYELTLFLTTLIQGEVEGTLVESLERYKEVLEINYFKCLKRKAAVKTMYVALGTVLSLIGLVLMVMYPIIMQVFNNLQLIFA